MITPAQGEALTDAATQVVVGAPNMVTINPPSAAAGTYQAGFANFGPAPTVTGVSGAIVLVNDGGANTQSNPDLGCGPLIGFPGVRSRSHNVGIATSPRKRCTPRPPAPSR